MALLKSTPPALNEERVKGLRDQIDAFIDDRAAAEAKLCPGVPLGVIRNLLTARSNGCQCAAYLALNGEDA